ncbi:MAG TPA: ABC transporter substrate-binding protein [Gemmatimonadales bacterium]|nr:ABC transporter substrate-binding protein [Gemmatimonadales bacterium]
MVFLARSACGIIASALLLLGCEERPGICNDCGTVVIAAPGEPTSLVPPLVDHTVGRDISDQIYERLAYLEPGASPIDPSSYRKGLAQRWERIDSLTWRFHLRPDARWQDGRPVTAADVVFSFEAFSDSTLDSPARTHLAGRSRAMAEDSATVRVAFTEPSPEQFYDATYHVRVFPRHIWDSIPRARWSRDTSLAHLVGSGPYHISSWQRGRFLTLVADSNRAGADSIPAIRRAVWRFVPDPDAALNLILSHEADLMETVGAPARAERVARDTSFRLVTYPAAVYGFLAFRVADAAGRPHPVLGQRELRRALTEAVDRPSLARAVFGEGTKVPPGPMSQLLWIWDEDAAVVRFDSSHAREVVAQVKARRPITRIDILVPSTSPARRQLAVVIQEAWRKAGVNATVTAVDFPVFQERLAQGRFDTYIGAYLDEPTPRALTAQWTRAGWGALNYGRYANPAFDSLLSAASREGDVEKARRLWRQALDTINADAPAIFLYSLANVAAVHRRLRGVELDPYSWASGLPGWKIDPDQALARDSAR